MGKADTNIFPSLHALRAKRRFQPLERSGEKSKILSRYRAVITVGANRHQKLPAEFSSYFYMEKINKILQFFIL